MDGRVLDNIWDYYEMVDSAEARAKLELRCDFDVAMLDNSSKDFVRHLFSNHEWALVYWDDKALVFLKRIVSIVTLFLRMSIILSSLRFMPFNISTTT